MVNFIIVAVDFIRRLGLFFKKSAIFALPREKMHHSFRAPTV